MRNFSPAQPEPAYFTFAPRPDQPELYDEQEAFYNSQAPGVAFLIGGNGCIAGDSVIYDPVEKRDRIVSEIDGPFHVWARNPETGERKISEASRPFVKGIDNLYRVTLDSGKSFVCTMKHRVMCPTGWTEVSELLVGDVLLSEQSDVHAGASRQTFADTLMPCAGCIQESTQSALRSGRRYTTSPQQGLRELVSRCVCVLKTRLRSLISRKKHDLSVSPRHAWNCQKTTQGSRSGCSDGPRQYGGQPRPALGSVRSFFPSQVGVLGHIRQPSPMDGLSISTGHIRPCQQSFHHSRSRSAPLGHRDHADLLRSASAPCLLFSDLADTVVQGDRSSTTANLQKRACRPLPEGSSQSHTTASCRRSATGKASAYRGILVGGNGTARIVHIERAGNNVFYDLTVTPHHNYLMAGCWHHNSGTTEMALAKAARFVFTTPPPRRDTPFWILSDDYPTVMESAWKEKLHGHGHIPTGEVDWERIQWYKPNMDWPFRVPLKPWPGYPDTNWLLEFKAYGQGRQRLQARSIGGFCFIEQFPWGLLEEVLRGCREYNFPGSKFCEFTPVDPNLSIEIEEMLSDMRPMPPGWEFYRCNTQCAVDAGHVSQSWFDEFFSMIPDEMRETRMNGSFANYEGAVYQGFNPAIHCVGDDVINFPVGVQYRRGIDWGTKFACVFAYENSYGQWYIFDEYYSTDETKTVIDHLCEVSDSWLWPAHNPAYGMTYADPSEPDDIRIANKMPLYTGGRYDPLPIRGANNSVLEGIEHIQWLLKPTVKKIDYITGEERLEPRLFIHRDNCPNLIRQMKGYRWLRASDGGLNPTDARRAPLKKDDHLPDALRYVCFTDSRQLSSAPTSIRKEDRARKHGVLFSRGNNVR